MQGNAGKMPGKLITADIPYRLIGGGKPTMACTPDASTVSNPQSSDFHFGCLEFNGTSDACRLPPDDTVVTRDPQLPVHPLNIRAVFGSQDLNLEQGPWSFMLWVMPSDLAPDDTQTLFEMHKWSETTVVGGIPLAPDDQGAFSIKLEPGGTLSFRRYSNTGAIVKHYQIEAEESSLAGGVDGWFTSGVWNQLFVTWDPDTDSFLMYRNGYLMNPHMTVLANGSGSPGTGNNYMSIGATVSGSLLDQEEFFEGAIHSVAYWSENLSQDAIRQVWNQGYGSTFNLLHGVGDYTNSRELEAWWQLGKDPAAPVMDSTNNVRHMEVWRVEDTEPVGTILAYGGAIKPPGYLMCNGGITQRASFSDLFDLIGTTYGAGDGSTTFNLPDLTGRIPQGYDASETDFAALGSTGGAKTHTLTVAELPEHSHDISVVQASSGDTSTVQPSDEEEVDTLSTATTGGGAAHENMPPYTAVRYIIKAASTAADPV